MTAVPCKCGKMPRVWKLGDVYLCGCLNPGCNVPPNRSMRSKEHAIEKWNEKMKGENNND